LFYVFHSGIDPGSGEKDGAPWHFILKFAVNFKGVFQIPKFYINFKDFLQKEGLGGVIY
jgi:hypothetical protein